MMDSDEAERLGALRKYAVLDTPPEPNFDRITSMAASIFNKPVCTLSLADTSRHWFKSRYGVDATEMPRRMSFCDQTIGGEGVFVVEDAFDDPRFAAAPVVAGPPHLRFYAGAPLVTAAGQRIGSLCVLDTQPRSAFSETDALVLTNLAQTVVELLEARSRQLELAEATKAIAHLALHDVLTGLPNRRGLAECFARIVSRAAFAEQLAVLFLDLDGFKAVNDTYGHLIGDQLLGQVAKRLDRSFRARGPIARVGGDEFVVLRLGSGDVRSDAAAAADRIIGCLQQPFIIEGRRLDIGVSIGIAVGQACTAVLDTMLQEADTALYRVKASGRGHYLFDRATADAAGRSAAA